MRLQHCNWYETSLGKEVRTRSYRPLMTKVNSWECLPRPFRLCIAKQTSEGKERTHFCPIQSSTLSFANFIGYRTEPTSCVPQTKVFLWAIAYQAPPSMGFSRQDYWRGLPFLLQGIFPTQGLNPGLLHCRQTLYDLSHQRSPKFYTKG